MQPETDIGGGARQFPTTRWTLILASQGQPIQREAFGELLQAYWKPLYLFVRRRGLDAEGAKDAVQGFIMHLLERDFLARLDPGKGRLRSYLKTAIRHYLANLYERESAKKRGGDAIKLSLDFDVAEGALSSAPESPDEAYDRQWALGIMHRALEQLRGEFESGSRKGPFEVVVKFFEFGTPPAYRDIAAEYDMTIPQLKAFLHRARVRFRELVRAIILDTVHHSDESDDEMTAILEALGQ